MDRRTFLASSAAAAVVAPIVSVPAVAATPVIPPKSWVVGSPGEYDWLHCWGDTEHEAKLDWLTAHVGENTCEHGHTVPHAECDCEVCYNYRGLEFERVEKWDGKESIAPGDWLRAGLGHTCSRCGNETDPDEGRGVNAEAVCGDCMKLEDWDIVDPERAAEMRADLED